MSELHAAERIPLSGGCAGSGLHGIERTRMQPHMSEPRNATLYRMYDADGVLLYIGATVMPRVRLHQHHPKPWWRHVARIQLEHFPSERAAFDAERIAIAEESPVFNVRGNKTVTPTPA